VPSCSFAMSISRSEFLRLLPEAVGGLAFVAVGKAFVHEEPGRSWRITLEAMPDLALGHLRLERHEVEWSFRGYTEAEIAENLERFHRHFQRGGG
jgi:hypothetical protein